MHETLFAAANLPFCPRVLRLRLKAFSIGHEIRLSYQSNPLSAFSGMDPDQLKLSDLRHALIEAVLICHRDWSGNFQPNKNLGFWGWIIRKMDIQSERKKYIAYRNAGMIGLPQKQMPKVAGANYHYFGAPDTARLFLFVQGKALHQDLGLKTPYDFPYGLASQLYFTELEQRGDIWVKNFDDQDMELRRELFDQLNPTGTFGVGDDQVKEMARKWNAEHPNEPITFLGELDKN